MCTSIVVISIFEVMIRSPRQLGRDHLGRRWLWCAHACGVDGIPGDCCGKCAILDAHGSGRQVGAWDDWCGFGCSVGDAEGWLW
jgi:hypothetical protein